jgi:hypothetical protein
MVSCQISDNSLGSGNVIPIYTLKETRSAILQDESKEKLVIFRSNDAKFSYDFAEFQNIFPEIFTDGLHGPKYPRKAPLDPSDWLINVLKGPQGRFLENSRTFIGVYFDLLVRNRTSRNMYRTLLYKPNAPLSQVEEYVKSRNTRRLNIQMLIGWPRICHHLQYQLT